MYNFLTINPGDNPNEGRNKINYNFSLISGGTMTGGTSGGTPAGNTYEVQFNLGGNFYASPYFKFNPNDNTLVEGYKNSIYGTSNYSSIIGGKNSYISNTCTSSIIGTKEGYISNGSRFSGIFGGFCNCIQNGSQSTGIFAGAYNIINYSNVGLSLGSVGSFINNSDDSSIVGGYFSKISESTSSTLIGGIGFNNYYPNIQYGVSGGTVMSGSQTSVIIGGGYRKEVYSYPYTIRYNYPNRMYNSSSSAILVGHGNCVNDVKNSTIIGGISNVLSGLSCNSSIIGGVGNKLFSCSKYSSIIGGVNNKLTYQSCYSSIIGGYSNIMSGSCRSAIFGGQNFSLISENDTVLVPNLKVATSISSLSGGTFYSGITGTYIVGTNTFTIVNGIITSLV